MDDRRNDGPSPSADIVAPAGLTEGPSPVEPAPAAPATPKRSWKGLLGITAALVVSFAWGALTYRELGTGQRPVAVAGSESPPGWVADFAQWFCDGDSAQIATRIGPPLEGQAAEIEEALQSREWTCADVQFLGGGTNSSGEFYAYITVDQNGGEQWWVFTVADEKVVAIE